MSATDAPDWQEVITLTSGGSLTDAPDWTNVVTGPGGTPPVTGGGIQGPGGIWTNMGVTGLTIDPWAATQTGTIDLGAMYTFAFIALATSTAFSINVGIAVGASGTANENYVGLYDSGQSVPGVNSLIAQSAPGVAEGDFTSTGLVQVVLSSHPTIIAGGTYFMALLVNGASPSFFRSEPSTTLVTQPFEGTFVAAGRTPTTHTTLPSTLTSTGFALYNVLMQLD